MPQPTVAAEIHQPLDVHGHLAPKVALDDVVAVDDLADLQHLLVGQLRHPAGMRPPDLAVLAFVFNGLRAAFLTPAVLVPRPLCLPSLPAAVLARFSGALAGGFLTAAPRSTRSMALPTCGIGAMPSTERNTL